MVTDKQVKDLLRFLLEDRSIARAARLTDMDEKTARKYRDLGKLPSDVAKPHDWRTRPNPFETVWSEVCELLDGNPGLQAKTIFGELVIGIQNGPTSACNTDPPGFRGT